MCVLLRENCKRLKTNVKTHIDLVLKTHVEVLIKHTLLNNGRIFGLDGKINTVDCVLNMLIVLAINHLINDDSR